MMFIYLVHLYFYCKMELHSICLSLQFHFGHLSRRDNIPCNSVFHYRSFKWCQDWVIYLSNTLYLNIYVFTHGFFPLLPQTMPLCGETADSDRGLRSFLYGSFFFF